jgi:hypothetical protein
MLETTGVDVWGACGDFGFSERCWRLVLALGRHYGWRPEERFRPTQTGSRIGAAMTPRGTAGTIRPRGNG